MTQTTWTRYCKYILKIDSLGVSVDPSKMNFSDDFFEKLSPALSRALSEMNALEAGEIANPDENRMVGHYWLRDPQLAPSKEMTTP